ncbi:FecCD family ABC transporter permease [Derxia lacustris]|uniref:FecCD family ABC transporter permease n=1 Tax=Derxia lacustris TaxID=764842 RepID=UPI000A17432F|nr:iron ABC transporter permease [Derxia lacustris]
MHISRSLDTPAVAPPSLVTALRRARAALLLPGLALALLLAMALALAHGRYPLPAVDVLRLALADLGLLDLPAERLAFLHNLVWDIRLPRVLAAVLVGAALATSGAAYQAVFANPLVSPNILGVLAGAAFGAALGIVVFNDWRITQLTAIAGGFAAVAVGAGIARLFGIDGIVMLVLGGILSGALFSALLSLVKYTADPLNQLPAIVYWLMGTLGQADLPTIARLAPAMLGSIALLLALARQLDALAMGEVEAASLGVPVALVRGMVIAAATVASALTVAMAGMIGWLGLLVPHIARLAVGPVNARLLPASALIGAIFLLGADAIARGVTTAELPIGLVTELAGLPIFLLVLGRVRRAWAA